MTLLSCSYFDFIKRLNNVTYALVNLSTGEVITDSETGETLQGKKAYLIDTYILMIL